MRSYCKPRNKFIVFVRYNLTSIEFYYYMLCVDELSNLEEAPYKFIEKYFPEAVFLHFDTEDHDVFQIHDQTGLWTIGMWSPYFKHQKGLEELKEKFLNIIRHRHCI